MCGRYVIKTKIEIIEKRFQLKETKAQNLIPNFNVSPGDLAPVITSEKPDELQFFRFGMTPSWSKKSMYLINARAEGDKNKEDDINYKGSKEIAVKPAFRKPIRSQRCLVLADAFIEGPTIEKLEKPFLVYLRKKEAGPFAFAGIWDAWLDEKTGEEIKSFAIITTVSNKLLQMIPHHRCPVILQSKEDEQLWLNKNVTLAEILEVLRPFPANEMNAYPISNEIKSPKNKEKSLLNPVGQRLVKEVDYKFEKYLERVGFGRRHW